MNHISMKTLIVLIFLCCCNLDSFSQCNEYYVFQQGSEWEYENYNGKGKLSGRNKQKVTAFNKTDDGFNATVNTLLNDEKGKEIMKGDLQFKCQGGVMYIDMRNFITEEQLKAYKDYEMKVEADNLELPSGLSAGQTLKDGKVTVTAVGGPIPMKMTVTISDRKVEGKETITTPAGTFDAFKIKSKSTIQNQMGINVTMEYTLTEWIAPK